MEYEKGWEDQKYLKGENKEKDMHIVIPFPAIREGGGGIASFIRQFAHTAAQEGHQVTLISSREGAEPAESVNDGVKTVHITVPPMRFLRRIRYYGSFNRKVNALLKSGKLGEIKVVLGVSNAAGAGKGFPLVFRSASGPVAWELDMWRQIWNVWDSASLVKRVGVTFDFWLQSWFERGMVQSANALLCQSKEIVDGFKHEYQVELPSHVPCTGVDTKLFHPAKALPPQKNILFVSGLSVSKGKRVLEQALPVIFSAHPDAKLTIIAKEWTGMELREQDKKRVKFIKDMPHGQLPKEYRKASVFVFPSVCNEGFPNVLLEAMASGLPIVTTRVAGINEYLDGKSASIVPKFDAQAFAFAVNKLLDSKTLRKSTGANARRKSARCAWSVVTKGILRFLEEQFC